MSNTTNPQVTQLLRKLSKGDNDALEQLLPWVLDDLRTIARRYVAKESITSTLETTDLVHDFFLRLDQRRELNFRNRKHFFGTAATIMRQILVDRARRRQRVRHGGGQRPLRLVHDPVVLEREAHPAEIIGIQQALISFESQDPRAAKVVEMRFFLGMTIAETAAALGMSPATVKRDWEFARLWLYDKMQGSALS